MEKSEIGREILAYLSDHPQARDTLEGIVEWWLLERKIKYQTKIIKEALSELVDKRLVFERQEKDLKYHYGIIPTAIERVLAFLKQDDK